MFGLISKKRLTKEIVELYERTSDDYFNNLPPNENSFYYCCGNHNALNYLSYRFNLGITEIIKENNHNKFFEKYWQAPKESVKHAHWTNEVSCKPFGFDTVQCTECGVFYYLGLWV